MTRRALLDRLSREGVTGEPASLRPFLWCEKGFQAIERTGPGYDEEIARPVLALIIKGKPRLFLVRGTWGPGRYGQYHVARGNDFLRPRSESPVIYLGPDAPLRESIPDLAKATARRSTPAPPPEPTKSESAYDWLLKANGRINSVVFDFLGRASNEEMFPSDDLQLANAAAAAFAQDPTEYNRAMRDSTGGGRMLGLLNYMIQNLEHLRDVYSADRETIKAWRTERLEAYDDAFDGLLARLNYDHEAYKVSPEYKRWQAIQDVDALEYPLSPQERTRRDEARAKVPSAPPPRVAPTIGAEKR